MIVLKGAGLRHQLAAPARQAADPPHEGGAEGCRPLPQHAHVCALAGTGRHEDAAEDADQGRLSCAVGTEDPDHVAAVGDEADVLEGDVLPPARPEEGPRKAQGAGLTQDRAKGAAEVPGLDGHIAAAHAFPPR